MHQTSIFARAAQQKKATTAYQTQDGNCRYTSKRHLRTSFCGIFVFERRSLNPSGRSITQDRVSEPCPMTSSGRPNLNAASFRQSSVSEYQVHLGHHKYLIQRTLRTERHLIPTDTNTWITSDSPATVLTWGALVRQSFNGILALDDIHQRDSRYLAYPPPKLPIARCYDVASISRDAVNKAIIGVGARVRTREAFKSRISSNSEYGRESSTWAIYRRGFGVPECHSVLHTELFQLCHYAIRDARDTCRCQEV